MWSRHQYQFPHHDQEFFKIKLIQKMDRLSLWNSWESIYTLTAGQPDVASCLPSLFAGWITTHESIHAQYVGLGYLTLQRFLMRTVDSYGVLRVALARSRHAGMQPSSSVGLKIDRALTSAVRSLADGLGCAVWGGWHSKARVLMGNGRWRDRAPKLSRASALHRKTHAPFLHQAKPVFLTWFLEFGIWYLVFGV